MLIDHEHFRHDLAQESRAYGWLNRLQARPDGVYGQIRWTQTGKAAWTAGITGSSRRSIGRRMRWC